MSYKSYDCSCGKSNLGSATAELTMTSPLLTGLGWSSANATDDESLIVLLDLSHLRWLLIYAGLDALDIVTR